MRAGRSRLSGPVSVGYPDRDLDRVPTFRLFTAIPIVIVLGSVGAGTWRWSYDRGTAVAAGAGDLLSRPPFGSLFASFLAAGAARDSPSR